VAYNLLAQQRGWALAATALTPHTLLGSALSLLLVFRTNASFARMVEARQARPPRGRPPCLGRRRRAPWPGRGAACACRVPVVGEASVGQKPAGVLSTGLEAAEHSSVIGLLARPRWCLHNSAS